MRNGNEDMRNGRNDRVSHGSGFARAVSLSYYLSLSIIKLTR